MNGLDDRLRESLCDELAVAQSRVADDLGIVSGWLAQLKGDAALFEQLPLINAAFESVDRFVVQK